MTMFLFILLILILIFLIFFVTQFYNIVFRGFAPFVCTKPKVIKGILEELKVDDKAIIYELGCGRAGFLHACRKKYPKAELIGVEYSFLPYIIGQIQNSFIGDKLKIIKQNFLKVDLSQANVVYCYLNIETMKKLAVKFEKECRPGTIIISYLFPLPNMESEKILKIRHEKDKVYFYRT
jgi:trans-aconitate methyltransferase